MTVVFAVFLIAVADLQAQSIFEQESASCEFIYGENLETWPYYSAYLPREVMEIYVVADTLCRLYTEEELAAKAAVLSKDSLVMGLNALIKAQDHNYLLFRHIQALTWKLKPEAYKTDYMALQRVLENEYFSRIEDPTIFDTIRQHSLGGVIHARVLNTEVHLDSSIARFGSSRVNEVYCADVKIISSVFGATSVSICEGQEDGEDAACVHLTWSCPTENEFDKYYPQYSYDDYGPDRLRTNIEYIIFTDMWIHSVQTNSIKYYIQPKSVLPVIDVTVHDKFNSLGLGERVDIDTFVQTLRNGIMKIN